MLSVIQTLTFQVTEYSFAAGVVITSPMIGRPARGP